VNVDDAPVSHDEDEFRFLPQDAERLGVSTIPPVERVGFTEEGEYLSALRWGSDPAPRLVLLHGGALNAHSWDRTLLALGRGAVAIDLPGHGDSAWREDRSYSAPFIAGSIARALRYWATPPYTVIGHSMGSLGSLAALPEIGHDISKLVLVDISPGRKPREQNPILEFIRGPESYESREEIFERAQSLGFGNRDSQATWQNIALNTRRRADGRYVFKHHIAHEPPSPAPTDVTYLWEPLEAFEGDIMLVYGSRGVLAEEDIAEFARRLPSARLEQLPAGHNVQRDAPVELANLLADFDPS